MKTKDIATYPLTVTPRYKLQQRVWVMHDNKAFVRPINDIVAHIWLDSVEITYGLDCLGNFSEELVFPTKEALLESL